MDAVLIDIIFGIIVLSVSYIFILFLFPPQNIMDGPYIQPGQCEYHVITMIANMLVFDADRSLMFGLQLGLP